jgi:hypothetical protein
LGLKLPLQVSDVSERRELLGALIPAWVYHNSSTGSLGGSQATLCIDGASHFR